MATAAAAEEAPAPKKGKKKLFIIIGVLVLLLAGGGGAAVFMMKKNAHAEEEGEEGGAKAEHAPPPPKPAAKHDPKAVPTFVPLDPFTVNLADRDADRYAQIGVTLELDDAKSADQIKAFMPAIRNNVLMVLAHKTSAQLLEREGKDRLAEQVRRETERALGLQVEEDDDEESAGGEPPKKKKKKRQVPRARTVVNVHFSTFIIQ